MKNTNYQLIKGCINDGLALRKDILSSKYLDEEAQYLCEQWFDTTTNSLATVDKESATAFEERSCVTLCNNSEGTKTMFATKITVALNMLEDILLGKDVTQVKFSLKTPKSFLKKTSNLYTMDLNSTTKNYLKTRSSYAKA